MNRLQRAIMNFRRIGGRAERTEIGGRKIKKTLPRIPLLKKGRGESFRKKEDTFYILPPSENVIDVGFWQNAVIERFLLVKNKCQAIWG